MLNFKMDPDSVTKYVEMAKTLNIPQGEMLNFVRDALKTDREERAKQREIEKKEKREEEERKEKLRIEEAERKEKIENRGRETET